MPCQSPLVVVSRQDFRPLFSNFVHRASCLDSIITVPAMWRLSSKWPLVTDESEGGKLPLNPNMPLDIVNST
jgi:hypothetical protein